MQNIPKELKDLQQWVCWRGIPKDNGKLDKIPVDPKTGDNASSTTPSTWGTFDQARQGVERYKLNGVGFVFFAYDKYCGIDLDNCIDAAGTAEWAQRWVDAFASYTEITPSGKGLHIIIAGKLPEKGHKKGNYECYDQKRFFTFTGQCLNGFADIQERQQVLDAFHRDVFPEHYASQPQNIPKPDLNISDSELIEKACRDAKFQSLWNGDFGAYPSQSEADQALCNKLAFWTRRDPQRINALFRSSGLYRKKWDRDDYRNATINKAIEQTQNVYDPQCRQQTAEEPPPYLDEIPFPDEAVGGEQTETPQSKPICLSDAILEDMDFIALPVSEKKAFLHPWLTEQQITLISGWRGVGKSWFAAGIMDAITKGESFGPWKAEHPVNCLYLDGEMAVIDTRDRLVELGTSGRKAKLFVYCDAHAYQSGLARANLLNQKWRDGMLNELINRQVKVFTIDNSSSLCPGLDENSKELWDPINQWLIQLRFAGISTLLLHHLGKTGTQRGTSAREDNVDISIELKKPPDYAIEDGCRFIASFVKSRIPTEHLSLLTDMEFKLEKVIGDNSCFTWKTAKMANKLEVIKYLDQGMSQTDIASVMGLTKGRVSQIKTEAVKEGIINNNGSLTQHGFQKVSQFRGC